MSNEDRSASGRTRRLKARTLAVYHKNNPTVNDFGGSAKPSNALTELLRTVGTYYGPEATCETCLPCDACDFTEAFVFPYALTDISGLETEISEVIGQPFTVPQPPEGYTNYYGLNLIFPPPCDDATYTIEVRLNGNRVVSQNSTFGPYSTPGFEFDQTVFGFIYPSEDVSEGDLEVFVTATNSCSSSTTLAQFGCFLEGAPVTMADGSKKPIQDVKVGDSVLGAFGETNRVLALHRPILGAGSVVRINDEHSTTSHHPHVGADKQFFSIDPNRISSMTYGKDHTVILGNGKKEVRRMTGLASGRIKKLEIGTVLQTSTGGRAVTSLTNVPMSPYTQVYHLVVSGSHTFIVEDYAVTGWPREDDFDYDAWVPRA